MSKRRRILLLTSVILVLPLAGCQVAADGPILQTETETAIPAGTPAKTTETSTISRPSPATNAPPTPTTAIPSPTSMLTQMQAPTATPEATPASTRAQATAPTALPPSPPPAPPEGSDAILVYGLSGARMSGNYAEAVIAAVTADLAARLDLDASAISVTAAGNAEAQLAAPCGATPKEEGGLLPGGLSVGYEVLLSAGGQQHRYVAVGGLAHHCPGH